MTIYLASPSLTRRVTRTMTTSSEQFRESAGDKMPVGVWKQGGLLVLHRDAPLPDVCLVTNMPTNLRLRRTFLYLPGAVALTFLLSPFIWLLVRWLIGERFELPLPLSAAYLEKERRLRIIRAIFTSLGVLMIFAGLWQLIDPRLPAGGWEMILGGIGLSIATYVWNIFAATRLRVTRYEEPYVWLAGVNGDLVEKLPDWPYE